MVMDTTLTVASILSKGTLVRPVCLCGTLYLVHLVSRAEPFRLAVPLVVHRLRDSLFQGNHPKMPLWWTRKQRLRCRRESLVCQGSQPSDLHAHAVEGLEEVVEAALRVCLTKLGQLGAERVQ